MQLSRAEGRGTVSSSVLTPKDLSHLSFITVVIVRSCWVFDLVNSKFHSHISINVQK